jgi:hypothetical protein
VFSAKTQDDSSFVLWQIDKTSLKLLSRIDKNELIKMAKSTKFEEK